MNKLLLFLTFFANMAFAMEINLSSNGKKVKLDGETKKVIKLVNKLSKATILDVEVKDENGKVKDSIMKKIDPKSKDAIFIAPNTTAHIRGQTEHGPISMDFTSGEFKICKEDIKALANKDKKEKEKKAKKRSSTLPNSHKKSVAFADLAKKK